MTTATIKGLPPPPGGRQCTAKECFRTQIPPQIQTQIQTQIQIQIQRPLSKAKQNTAQSTQKWTAVHCTTYTVRGVAFERELCDRQYSMSVIINMGCVIVSVKLVELCDRL